MPQARTKPAAARPSSKAAKKATKRAPKSAAKASTKRASGSARKGSAGRSPVRRRQIFFWVFAISRENLQQSGVALVSAVRGTPPIRDPRDERVGDIVGLDCKLPIDDKQQPALQFIPSPLFASRPRADAYITETVEGRRLHDAADNDVLYTVIAGE